MKLDAWMTAYVRSGLVLHVRYMNLPSIRWKRAVSASVALPVFVVACFEIGVFDDRMRSSNSWRIDSVYVC